MHSYLTPVVQYPQCIQALHTRHQCIVGEKLEVTSLFDAWHALPLGQRFTTDRAVRSISHLRQQLPPPLLLYDWAR
jgi:hypothetical protein